MTILTVMFKKPLKIAAIANFELKHLDSQMFPDIRFVAVNSEVLVHIISKLGTFYVRISITRVPVRSWIGPNISHLPKELAKGKMVW